MMKERNKWLKHKKETTEKQLKKRKQPHYSIWSYTREGAFPVEFKVKKLTLYRDNLQWEKM